MPINTTYNPPNIDSFVKSALHSNAQGVAATITAGQSAALDLVLTEDHLMTGVWFVCGGGAYGDSVDFQILGPDDTVLNQFVTSWYVPPTAQHQIETTYPAKLVAGLKLRLVYHSTGASNVFVAMNYKLHKVLV